MSKFLNRLLGLKVELQNAVFQYFSDTLDAVVKQAKKLGRYDLGIMGNFPLLFIQNYVLYCYRYFLFSH